MACRRLHDQFGLTELVEWSKDELSVMKSWLEVSIA